MDLIIPRRASYYPNFATAPHDVINTGDEPLRLYAIYAPVHHAPGITQGTSDKAEQDEATGKDEPPAWTVQPEDSAPDEHAN